MAIPDNCPLLATRFHLVDPLRFLSRHAQG